MNGQPPSRRPRHERDPRLETLLAEINGILEGPERGILEQYDAPRYPVICIVGCARSGTTLMLQLLAGSGAFAYPTNILSRFYAAPYIGAKIQNMLTQHDFRGEIFDFKPEAAFASELGKTQGALAPNEFWYFWRRFFHFGEIQRLSSHELRRADSRTFLRELAAMENAFGKPVALKAMIMNWNLEYLDSILDRAIFVFVKRQPVFNIQSLLEARENYYGNLRGWYSFKPPEYRLLYDRSPIEQVAGQVFFTNKAIEDGLKRIDPGKQLVVEYEAFCKNPQRTYRQLIKKIRAQGFSGPVSFAHIPVLSHTNVRRVSETVFQQMAAAYEKISSTRSGG
jgi:hypothetical protein